MSILLTIFQHDGFKLSLSFLLTRVMSGSHSTTALFEEVEGSNAKNISITERI